MAHVTIASALKSTDAILSATAGEGLWAFEGTVPLLSTLPACGTLRFRVFDDVNTGYRMQSGQLIAAKLKADGREIDANAGNALFAQAAAGGLEYLGLGPALAEVIVCVSVRDSRPWRLRIQRKRAGVWTVCKPLGYQDPKPGAGSDTTIEPLGFPARAWIRLLTGDVLDADLYHTPDTLLENGAHLYGEVHHFAISAVLV